MLKHIKSQDNWTEKSLGAKGFTLIELLVVIIILGILAAVAIFAIGGINESAEKSACETEIGTVETAIAAWAAQNEGDYPDSLAIMVTDANGNLKKTPTHVLETQYNSADGTLSTTCP